MGAKRLHDTDYNTDWGTHPGAVRKQLIISAVKGPAQADGFQMFFPAEIKYLAIILPRHCSASMAPQKMACFRQELCFISFLVSLGFLSIL